MRDKALTNFVGTLTIIGLSCLCIGIGAEFGWPFGLMAMGAFAIFVAIVAS